MRIVNAQRAISLNKIKKEFSIQLLLIGLVVVSCSLFVGMLFIIRLF
jgi:hypothetical protein